MSSAIDGLDRRALLKGAIAVGLAGGSLSRASAATTFTAYPFSLGIAAGDPASDGFVIWTRIAPDPLLENGGMPWSDVEVTWQVATDPAMTRVVRSGVFIARPSSIHTVHVTLTALLPARNYFYRFRCGNAESAIGKARTLPIRGAVVDRIRFASAGCQRYEHGYFTAWRHIANEGLDFVFHYGDYIYETWPSTGTPRLLPSTITGACMTLADYRRRYAIYKTDADLQAAQASCAFLHSFDDHEVANDWTADADGSGVPSSAFLARRAAAFRAWYEHMPVRRRGFQFGTPNITAYRSFSFGRLLDLAVLDSRQYRSYPACAGPFDDCADADAAIRTMVGSTQESWLFGVLNKSAATWQGIAQQAPFARLNWQSFPDANSPTPTYFMGGWDGATAARARLVALLAAKTKANPVVLSGDVHTNMALEILADPEDPSSRRIGAEFIGTSISSEGDGIPVANEAAIKSDNPHLKFVNMERGYIRHIVTPRAWRADFRVVAQVSVPGAAVTTRKSFHIAPGNPALVSS